MDSAMFLSALTPLAKDLQNVTTTAEALMVSEVRATEIPDSNATVSMDSLYPALVQCFGLIILGYVAGRCKLLTIAETNGISTFTGTFALPALIFTSLVDLNWGSVNWTFLLAIFISKTIVFFIVVVVALLIGRPVDYARAGLLGIFCTQSNDFAIGYPIVEALYKNIHPEYAAYLYLMAPISLVILNPIGFVMMEIGNIRKKKREVREQRLLTNEPETAALQGKSALTDHLMLVFNTLRSLFLNPMIFMTILGIIGGIVFPNGLPLIIKSFLVTIGNSFSATALFLTGIKIVGQGNSLRGSGFILPIVLILVKILVLPLVCRQTVNIMGAGANFNETTELSTYAFLYGTFPVAPGAFVVAAQYNTEVELVAKGMVLCTFISAPLMFISAKMISLTNLNPVDFLNELDAFSFDISIAGVIAGIWVLVLLLCTKRFKRMPHRVTCCLVLSQLVCCTVIIFWQQSGADIEPWILYLQFGIYNVSSYSSWLWTSALAIIMLFLQCRSLCFVLKLWPYVIAFCWGIPTIITALLLVLDDSIITAEKHNPSAHYSTTQTAISVFLLVMCFIVTVGCLVLLQRYKKHEKNRTSDEQDHLPSSMSTANLLSHDYVDNANHRNGGSVLRKRNLNANILTSSSSSSASDVEDNEVTTESNVSTLVRRSSNKGKTQNNHANKITTPTNGNVKVLVDIEDLIQRGANGTTATTTNTSTDLIEHNNDLNDEEGLVTPRGGFCNSTFPVCGENASHCPASILRAEEQANRDLEPLENTSHDADVQQSLRHLALLITLLCSMFVSLSVCIWALVMDGMSGIYMEMSFLDVFLNFGQNVIVLAIFISLTGELFMPLLKYWRYLWYGANILVLPPRSRLSTETEHICEQFRTYHMDNCKKLIAKDRRWRIKVYRQVFYGSEFVSWLIEVGLAKDRIEAVNYARHLIDGRVLCHINNVYHFEDTNLLYKFCNRF